MYGSLSRLFHAQLKRFFKEELFVPQDPEQQPDSWKTVEYKEYVRMPTVALPTIFEKLGTLESALSGRHSSHNFGHRAMELQTLSSLLHFSAGINKAHTRKGTPHWGRFYPSAGALYPLEVYLRAENVVGLEQGLYHYNVKRHTLERIGDQSLSMHVKPAVYGWATSAAITCYVSAVWNRNFQKYHDYGYRSVLMEAGHLMQNFQLVAQALGLSYCSFVGFDEDLVDEVLDIKASLEENVLYAFTAE